MKRVIFATFVCLFMCVPFFAQAQKANELKGTVTDSNGEPLAGVVVMVKGTSTGTATVGDGSYSLSVPGNATLVFSSIGYKDLEEAVNGRRVINVVLEEDNLFIEDAVVVGYGVQKKENLTGAVSVVTSKSIQNRSNSNLGGILQGTVPGLTVTTPSGRPGESVSIHIRGWISINSGSVVTDDGFISLGTASRPFAGTLVIPHAGVDTFHLFDCPLFNYVSTDLKITGAANVKIIRERANEIPAAGVLTSGSLFANHVVAGTDPANWTITLLPYEGEGNESASFAGVFGDIAADADVTVSFTNTYAHADVPIKFTTNKKWATYSGANMDAPEGAKVTFTLYRTSEDKPNAVEEVASVELDGSAGAVQRDFPVGDHVAEADAAAAALRGKLRAADVFEPQAAAGDVQ